MGEAGRVRAVTDGRGLGRIVVAVVVGRLEEGEKMVWAVGPELWV